MTMHLIIAGENDGIYKTLENMCVKSARRIPAVDTPGTLAHRY